MADICTTTAIVQDFYKHYSKELLDGNESILLAVSGGPDSMALLDLTYELLKRSNCSPNIIVAHLNHCLRADESDNDARFVLEYCQKLQIACIIKKVDINSIASQTGQSTETAARNARYSFFSDICLEHNCKFIATAHHADDNAETVLHRIIRGTGIKGLSGIQPCRLLSEEHDIILLRPLIDISRKQIEQYLAENSIPSRLDSSNNSTDYTRNNLRNSLIPGIEKQFNPNFKQALTNLSSIAADASEMLTDIALSDIQSCQVKLSPGLCKIPLNALASLSKGRSANILRYCLESIGTPMGEISSDRINKILTECQNTQTRPIATLPGNWQAEISDSFLIIASYPDDKIQPIELPIPCNIQLTNLIDITNTRPINSITTEILDLASFDLDSFKRNKKPNQEIIDLDKVSPPLTIAPLQLSQKFTPLGLKGSQTTGDIMTNHKVPQYLRGSIAAVYDQQNIIFISGLRIADHVKVTAQTKNAAIITIHQ